MISPRALFLLILLTLPMIAVGCPPTTTPPKKSPIEVNIWTTSFGIPHVKGKDWASMGYGLGYAYARDNLCILAREIVSARGEEAKYFGDSGSNVSRSLLFALTSRESELRRLFVEQPKNIQDAVHGYAAGYNRWLAKAEAEGLVPEKCAGEPWVRPIEALDLSAVFAKGQTRGSLDPLRNAVVNAAPPEGTVAAEEAETGMDPVAAAQGLIELDGIEAILNVNRNFEGGSNAYGLGRDATTNGRGMLLGNPHEPWSGIQRFYQAHLMVDGELDVMGVTQIALPAVVIGFNKDVAWSHTISTAKRFTFYELHLDPDDPLAYFYTNEAGETERRTIEPVTVEIEVQGESEPRRHTFWRSHYGWMIDLRVLSGIAPAWGDDIRAFAGPESAAYTLRDVNEPNNRGIEQWLQMDMADGVHDLRDKLETTIGLPFVNTIAADRDGYALYGDIGAVPNVDETKLNACLGSIVTRFIVDAGFPALDGSRADCEWGVDPATPQDGILGPDDLPSLITTDYVTNSNDSYWLSNPDQRLEGFSPLLRRDLFNEQGPRILRTRIGILQVQERLAGLDGFAGNRFDLPILQAIFYGNRNYSAELALEDVVADCLGGPIPANAWPTSGGGTVDVQQACEILEGWDRTDNVDSVGAHIWRRFFRRLGREVEKYAVPFDVNDPVNTPAVLTIDTRVREALGDAVAELAANGLALDAPLGEIQYVTTDGEPLAADGSNRIPMHGGEGQNGVFNVASTRFGSAGFTPITGGPTYMQTVTWDDEGQVVAEALLGFSQSDDPENPHYVDQTLRYSTKDFIRLPFTQAEILADLQSKDVLTDRISLELPPAE